MTFRIRYDVIGKKIHQECSISNLSGRCKVELFTALMEELGITDRLHNEPDETGRAQKIMTEQFDKHWGAA